MSLLTIDPLETAHAYDSGDRRILAKEPTRKASAGVLFRRAGEFDQQDGSSNPMWTRLERNWYKDAKEFKQPSGVKNFMPMFVTSARLRHTPSGDPMLAGKLSFSNSITIQRNTLGPGAVGHILRSRSISPTTYTATDRWFAYDQVGSVLAETDANGDVAAVHHSDAWGNRLEAWDTGVWGGQRSGWAHNTKEIDPHTDLTYMYQRWYNPETGTFLSRAPYPPMMEHEYGFAGNNPVMFVDPDGRQAFPLPGGEEANYWAGRAIQEAAKNGRCFVSCNPPIPPPPPPPYGHTVYRGITAFWTSGPSASGQVGVDFDQKWIGLHSTRGFGGGGGAMESIGLVGGISPRNSSDANPLSGGSTGMSSSAAGGAKFTACRMITRDDETGRLGAEGFVGLGAGVNVFSVQRTETNSMFYLPWPLPFVRKE